MKSKSNSDFLKSVTKFSVYFTKMKFPMLNSPTAVGLPIILINWMVGFGVIQYPIGKLRPIISAVWSLAHFLVYLNFVRMINFPAVTELWGSKIAANNLRILTYCCVAFVAVSMSLAYARAKVVQRIFANFASMNVRLKALGVSSDYELAFKALIIHICVSFTWMIAIVILDWEIITFEFPSETSRVGFFMSSHYFLVFAFAADCSFIVNIRYFGNRFHRLNELLIKSDSSERTKATFTQRNNNLPSYSLVINEIHGNDSPSIRAANKQWLFHVVRETRKIHRSLCKTAMELNRVYGLQILFSLALTFFLIIAHLYTSYIFDTSGSLTDKSWPNKIIVLMWLIHYVMKIFLLVNACEVTSCEANRTGQYIAQLLNTTSWDQDIRNEVTLRAYCIQFRRITISKPSTLSIFMAIICNVVFIAIINHNFINVFSLQLLQNPLSFTASGFFTLNYSLVRGIIGSVTTYLVIMIQMRSIYEPEDLIPTSDSTMLVQINSTG